MSSAGTVIYLIVNSLIICAFFAFLYGFWKLKEKNHGLYSILILNISDFSTLVFSVLTPFFKNDKTNSNLLEGLISATYRFSLFWTTAFALYSYLTLKYVRYFNSLKYLKLAFPLCLIISLLVCVM